MCNFSGAVLSRGVTKGVTLDQEWQKKLYITLRDADKMDVYDRCMTDDAYREEMYKKLKIKPQSPLITTI